MRELKPLFEQIEELANKMHALLVDEHAVLSAGEVEILAELTRRKSDLVASLTDTETRLRGQLAALGYDERELGLSQSRLSPLASHWKTIGDKLTECRARNQENELLAAARVSQTAAAMELLHDIAFGGKDETYGPHGNKIRAHHHSESIRA